MLVHILIHMYIYSYIFDFISLHLIVSSSLRSLLNDRKTIFLYKNILVSVIYILEYNCFFKSGLRVIKNEL